MSTLKNDQARADLLNRLKRAEGQLRGIQRMLEKDEDCLKIGQQFSAVRKALESTYLRMTMCLLSQEMDAHENNSEAMVSQKAMMLKDMQTMLERMA